MGSLADQLFAVSGAPLLMEYGGRSVTYRAPNVDDLTLTAVVGEIVAAEVGDDQGLTVTQSREIRFLRDSTATVGGIAEPDLRGEFTVDGVRWPVESVIQKTDTMVIVQLSRDATRERSYPNYRSP